LNWTTKRLANGEVRTYWFAWRGGPRLIGDPGSPEFVASYNEAVARKVATPEGVLQAVLTKFQQSEDFRQLAERTRKDYAIQIKIIERAFGDLPIAALSDPRTRNILLEWRERLALASQRQADYAWAVLARILAWALDRRRLVPANPCERAGLMYGGSDRADKVWSTQDESSFYERAPRHMHLPLLAALWTGQRQGDLLRLKWFSYDGTNIRLIQSKSIRRHKSGKRSKPVRVVIPVGAPLKAALDAAKVGKSAQDNVLLNSHGKPWTSDGFRTSWGKACAAAGIVGLTFHDLRGTAVTRLAIAGCTEAEIASITGHKLSDVRSIIDAYLHRDPALAESAIRKLEQGTNSQTGSQTDPECSASRIEKSE
jgi:integrase